MENSCMSCSKSPSVQGYKYCEGCFCRNIDCLVINKKCPLCKVKSRMRTIPKCINCFLESICFKCKVKPSVISNGMCLDCIDKDILLVETQPLKICRVCCMSMNDTNIIYGSGVSAHIQCEKRENIEIAASKFK